jgi:hypothetical protein
MIIKKIVEKLKIFAEGQNPEDPVKITMLLEGESVL